MLAFSDRYCPFASGPGRFTFDDEYGPKRDEVLKAWKKAEETLRSHALGERLLREIEEAKALVEVFWCPGNSAGLVDEGAADAACFVEVVDPKRFRELIQKLLAEPAKVDTVRWGHALRKLKAAGVVPYKVQGEEGWKLPATDLDVLQRGKVCYWLTEHLTRGDGAAAWVRWNSDKADLFDEFKSAKPPEWAKRPPWIALAHELIHAWRKATGRVVFHPKTPYYHEEAMTVGLPPYERGDFTENRFRLLAGEPTRSFYGPETQAKTEKAEKKYATK